MIVLCQRPGCGHPNANHVDNGFGFCVIGGCECNTYRTSEPLQDNPSNEPMIARIKAEAGLNETPLTVVTLKLDEFERMLLCNAVFNHKMELNKPLKPDFSAAQLVLIQNAIARLQAIQDQLER